MTRPRKTRPFRAKKKAAIAAPGTFRAHLAWHAGPQQPTAEMRADNLRSLAMGIEEALVKDGRGVSMERPVALTIKQALWDLADKVELE